MTTIAQNSRIDVDLLAQNLTAFMLGSAEPTEAFVEGLKVFGLDRTADGRAADDLADELGREIGQRRLVSEVTRTRFSLMAAVRSVLARCFG